MQTLILIFLISLLLAKYNYKQPKIYLKQVKIVLNKFYIFINKYTNIQLPISR